MLSIPAKAFKRDFIYLFISIIFFYVLRGETVFLGSPKKISSYG